jgi:thiol-disulfide isomerase/thioredoxin
MNTHRLAGALLLSLLFASANALAARPGTGDVAPDEFGVTLKGETPKLADSQGKVVVVSFWATWCGYCLKELPVLEGMQRAYKDKVQVIAVNTETRQEFRDALREMRNITMKMTYDVDKKGYKAYGAKGIPHLVIIGRDGKILHVLSGYSEESLPKIVDTINAALAAS